jgi:hypothetical protein
MHSAVSMGCSGVSPYKIPTDWINAVLKGEVDLADTPDSIQSVMRLPIYQRAVEIIRMDSQDNRRWALSRIPDKLRPYVEAEVKRLWVWRGEFT